MNTISENGHTQLLEQRVEALQAELAATQARLTQIEQATGTGLWTLDLSTNDLTWSPQIYEIYGLPADEPITMKQALSFFPDAARHLLNRAIAQVTENDIAWEFELPSSKATGEPIWVQISGASIRLNSSTAQIHGALQNITIMKLLRQRNQEREERYRVISDMMADYAYAMRLADNGELKREWMIGAFERITGFTPDEADERGGWSSLIHPEDYQTVVDTLQQMLTIHAERNYATCYRIIRKDGQIRHLNAINRPIYDPQTGQLTHIYGAARDVTEHTLMLETLRQNEELYRVVVQNQAELICQFDMDMTLSFINDSFCRFYGETADELVDRPLDSLFGTDVVIQFGLMRDKLVNSRGHIRFLGQLPDPAGELTTIEWTFIPIYDKLHEVNEILAVGHDITDRLRAEEQTRQLEIEQARMKILADFIKHAAHEFRTPLTTIGSSAYLLMRTTDPERAQKRHDMITEQIGRITRLVDMLVRLAALDTSNNIYMREVDLSLVIRQIVDQMQPHIQEKALRVSFELSVNGVTVWGDPQLLAEAFSHLIDNAIRFNRDGGSLILRGGYVDGDYRIYLTDTGLGMDPTAVKHVFQRFYRADEAHTTPGLGLGASIAARIIELHDGRIRVRSTPNVGTTVSVTLASP